MYRWPTNPSYIISPQFMAHTKKFLAKNFRILSGEKIKFIEQKTNSKWFFKRTKSPSDRPSTDRSVSTACESLKSAKLKHVLLKVHAISSKKPHLFLTFDIEQNVWIFAVVVRTNSNRKLGNLMGSKGAAREQQQKMPEFIFKIWPKNDAFRMAYKSP